MYLEIKNVSFRYTKKQVLKKVSFSIKRGETAVLIGPSGSGKTTLFHLITGFLPLQEGEILIDGKPSQESTSKISYLLHEDLLLPWRTVLNNILLAPEIRFRQKHEWKDKAIKLLEDLGLHSYKNAFPEELSFGMRQRVALARALILNPELILLDEPFVGIDPFRREALYQYLEKIQEKYEVTILFITHHFEDLKRLADRCCLIIHGQVAFEGPYTEESFLEAKKIFEESYD